MKKSMEILRAKNALKKEIENLSAEGKVSEAHAKIADLNRVNQEYEVQVTLENEETKEIARVGTPVIETSTVNPTVVFNKQVLGKPLTDEEQAYVENAAGSPGQIEHDGERGGYLVPEEQGKQILEYRREQVALKKYTNIKEKNTMSGKDPVAEKQTGMLDKFDELNQIPETEVRYKQQAWAISDYGKTIPVSNSLLEDAFVNIVGIIGKDFTTMAVNTENYKILELLKASRKLTGKSLDDIKTVLNKELDPAISSTSIIITNQDGFDWADKQKDKNGRDILGESLADPTKKNFKGREIVVLPDWLLPTAGKALPFYVGDLEQAINFYERKGVEIAVSTEAGFSKNATLLRAIERFDVQPFDSEAVVFMEITPGETPIA